MTRNTRRLQAFTLLIALAVAGLTPVTAVAQDHEADQMPATSLRITLDRALGEHAFLLGEVMRTAIADAPDLDAAGAAVESNSEELIGAIEGVYGPEASARFGELWRDHVGYVLDYARAVANGDADAAALAQDQLDRYVSDFSGFLAGAMPALPQSAVEGLIGEHVQQLEQVASFNAEDFGGAYDAIGDTFMHMFSVGDRLTVGIVDRFPEKFPGREQAFSLATDLRLTLDRLFGEHSYLAAVAMRAALRGDPAAGGAVDALSDNADALHDAIGLIYGTDAGAAFAELWQRHDEAYIDYVEARAAGDEQAAELALQALSGYPGEFSQYAVEVNPLLSATEFESQISDHAALLVDQADAFADGDYERAHELARTAYEHSGGMAALLAGAIADQFPERYPDAAVPKPAPPFTAVGIGLLLAALVLAVGREMPLRSLRRCTSQRTRVR